MSNPSVKLTEDELEASLKYIESTRASDFFPQPFEFQAIRHSWDKVRPVLEGVELLSYTPRPAIQLIAPKQRSLVRPAHLLDPIDTILYTGLIFRIAPIVESKRAEYQQDRVFTRHFDNQAVGSRETFKSDWDGFRGKAEKLSSQYQFVATADIVDFFPRVYLHRLKNALEDITGDTYVTRAIMRLVEGWSHGTSYGIPTGPHASNYLAEVLLIEVDQYLMSYGIDFMRWVDDYVIFGNSEADCLAGVFRLGARLHQTQGLSLNSAKTRIYTVPEYKTQVWREDDPTENLRKKIIDEVFGGNPYAEINYDDLSPKERAIIDQLDVVKSLDNALSGDLIDLGAVKFLLHVLSAFRRPDLIDPVLSSLDRLLPVADSVARFFDVLDTVEQTNHKDVGRRLMEYLQGPSFTPEFQTMWLLDPFTRSPSWNNLIELRTRARDDRSKIVRRQAILGLGQIGDRSSLLDVKSALDDTKDWERNATIYACRKLPKDEIEAMISQLGGAGGEWNANDVLQKSVLKFTKDSRDS